jgi:hypothetical protein
MRLTFVVVDANALTMELLTTMDEDEDAGDSEQWRKQKRSIHMQRKSLSP